MQPNGRPEIQGEHFREETGRLLEDSERILELARACLGGSSGDSSPLLRAIGDARQKWKEQRFRVAVLALMKAGKSTLLNAWLGDEYLPSSSAPETANMVKIRHEPQLAEGRLSCNGKVVATGTAAVRAFLASGNARFRESGSGLDDELLLEASLESMQTRAMDGARFEILDSPGPNEAGTAQLRTKVDMLLESADVIVYLLDYTKLKSHEEKGILQKLGARQDLIRRNADRLFFVVNKIDSQDRNGLTPEETTQYVANILKVQVPKASIPAHRILLLSADQALQARLIQSGRASPMVVQDFAKQQFGKIGGRTQTLESCRPHARRVLAESLLPELDDAVLTFIHRERGRLLLDSVLGDLERGVTGMHGLLQTAAGTLRCSVKDAERELASLRKDLKDSESEFAAMEIAADQAMKETEALVRKEFVAFGFRVDELITKGLRGEEAGGAGMPFSRLSKVVRDLLGREVAERDEATKTARKLDQSITSLVREEFEEFRVGLEQRTHDMQVDLFRKLSQAIQRAWRGIEGSVEKRLEINIRPVRVVFEAPSMSDTYEDNEIRVARYVSERTRKLETTKQVRERVKDKGWCSEAVYETRQVMAVEESQVHTIDPSRIRDYWHKQIEGMTTTSIVTAKAIIREKVGDAVERAREKVRKYREDYVATIEAQIVESGKGEAQRSRRMSDVDRLRKDADETLKGIKLCLRELN